MRFISNILPFLFSVLVFSQETGMPFYRVYEPQEYQGHRQNWAITQDENGVMYFANEGLLVFNGEDWQLQMVPNQRHLRSLDAGHGRIYVGGNNELGYFKKNGASYDFTSHLSHVPDSLQNFDRVWTTLVHKESVYYQTDTFVLRVSMDGTSKLWPFTQNRVWKLLLIGGSLHVDVPLEGFLKLNDQDEFELVPNGEMLKMIGMEYFLPINGGRLFEQRDVLKIFDGEKVSVFSNEASDIFLEYGLDSGLKTKSGDFVFATRRKGGVVVLDEEGKLKHHFTSLNGFSNEIVRNIYEDRNGSIWFALNTGISRLDLESPLHYSGPPTGLNGTTFAIQRFNNRLYAGTTDGLKVLNKSIFGQVEDITALIRDLDTVQKHLIIATSRDELYAMNLDGKVSVIDDAGFDSNGIFLEILKPKEEATSFICLFETGIFQVKFENNSWVIKQQLNGHFHDAESIVQKRPGELWVDTGVVGMYRIEYDMLPSGEFDFGHATVKKYFLDEGVPKGNTEMHLINDKIILDLNDGSAFFSYDPNADLFEKLAAPLGIVGLKDQGLDLVTFWNNTQENSTWFEVKKGKEPFLINAIKQKVGFEHIFYPLNTYATRFGDLRGANTFLVEKDRVYYGGIKGMVEYDIDKKERINKDVLVEISQIATSDTTYFELPTEKTFENLRHNNSTLSFHFTSTSFAGAENKKYQYKLEGFDSEWSEPSPQSIKEYTSLPPGDYTFKVKALNDYFMESPEASVSFTVNRPWYWNNSSIFFYILVLGLLTYLFSQWRTQNLKQKNLRLEQAVDKAVAQTKRQADEIARLYEVKNQFFSNISHELRTPLTLILGPSSDLLEDGSLKTSQKNKVTFINNNAKRLLRLINQLLDLSKLEAGKLDLRAGQQDIVRFASTITESFSSLAKTRGIRLDFSAKEDEIYVFYDMDKLEKVLINLLSNAMKFTNTGGRVHVLVTKEDGFCHISVQDSGIGINEEQLPYIFDRFFQADNSESREHEGTGIGLSLTKELVELHGGTIEAQSEIQKGSIFMIKLPLGNEHLQEHQLVKFKSTLSKSFESIAEPLIHEESTVSENTSGEMVLLVEDNAEMRSYIKSQLGNDFQILEAENGLIGLEMAKEHVPDLIISDVMMPKMDGTELCKKIKDNEVTSHIPLILLTAKASEEDRIQGLNLQADAYLAKPFNKQELRAQVKNLIVNRKKLQKRFAKTALISPKDIAVTSMEQQFLEKLVDEIEKNIGEEAFGVEQLAETIHLSRSQLHRKMISITNQTPSLFIRKYRLERAKNLLEQGAGRVSDIAFQVGFSSPSYFTKCFVEQFGKTPKEISK